MPRPVKAAAGLALAAAILIPIASASASAIHPIFVRADIETAGAWTAYRVSIQVRPLAFAIWPGGYLADGTFVQNGMLVQSDGLYAFVWATRDGYRTSVSDPVPLTLTRITPKTGSWVTFEMSWDAGRWTFRYQDADGWHVQGSFTSRSLLKSVQFVNEYWAETWRSFPIQVMHGVAVRSASTWTSPSLVHSPSPEACGHESITRSAPASLTFQPAEIVCRPYDRLLGPTA
jgi:hypothetical protein